MLKISIITVCYNSAKTIESTIQSVIGQSYQNIEYIIVDGLSTDATLTIVNKYADRITAIISEKDKGMYDALNKGIAIATGDIIGILNADDFYVDANVIQKIATVFETQHCDASYADLDYVAADDPQKIIRHWVSGYYKEGMFVTGWMPPHPTFFVRKNIYEKYGTFNSSLTSAADYELMLRFIHRHKIKLAYIPEVLVKMRVGGKSNISLRNRLIANKEDRQAWQLNNLQPKWYTLIVKPLSKLKQFLK